ncbi:MAG: hypothetical protein WD737_05310 [Gemmatimonadota bacterium]
MASARIAGWVAGFLLVLAAAPASSQTPALALAVGPAERGWPAVVQVGPLLDDEALRGALDSALPLRFHLRVELWRRGILDRLAAVEEISLAVIQDPLSGGFSVEGPGIRSRQVETIGQVQLALRALLSTDLRPTGEGRYYYLATLEVETLSLSDLDELRRWLRGDVAPAIEGRASPTQAVERGLRRLMIRVIGLPTRRFEARSANFQTG